MLPWRRLEGEERESAVRARTADACFLAGEHFFEADREVDFREEDHAYVVKGVDFAKEGLRSGTGVKGSAFSKFDGKGTVEKYFDGWKARQHPKYFPFIQASQSDEEAKQAILDSWENEGKEASRLGTALHEFAERLANGAAATPEEYGEVEVEARQVLSFFNSPHMRNEAPLRTELSIFAVLDSRTRPILFPNGLDADAEAEVEDLIRMEEEEMKEIEVGDEKDEKGGKGDEEREMKTLPIIITAGQIDLCTYRKEKDGSPSLDGEGRPIVSVWDWKRVKEEIDPAAKGFRGEKGKGPMKDFPSTQYYQMSIQQSLYSLLAEASHGLKVEGRTFLVRVNSKIQDYQLVPCADLREQASLLLRDELVRNVRERKNRCLLRAEERKGVEKLGEEVGEEESKAEETSAKRHCAGKG